MPGETNVRYSELDRVGLLTLSHPNMSGSHLTSELVATQTSETSDCHSFQSFAAVAKQDLAMITILLPP